MGSRKKTVSRRPTVALAQANALWRERRFDEALRCFSQAVRDAPHDLSVLIDAGRALGARYQMDRSRSMLSKALRLGSRRAEVVHAVGESYRMLGRCQEAEACFRKAHLLAASPTTELELARICERRNAIDEAEDWIARLLQTQPRSAHGLLLKARIARRRRKFDEAISILQRLAADNSVSPKLQAEAYGELSAVFDASEDYDAAWNAIFECKQRLLALEQTAWEAAQTVLARAQRLTESITADHFQRWQRSDADNAPQRLALLTGFPRSGTTLLEQVLAAHPDIVESDEREIFSGEVFPRLGGNHSPDAPLEQVLDELTPAQTRDARQLYLDCVQAILGEPIGTRLHLDKNPAMTLLIPAVRRVFPELKLLVALRDPRDVVLSCFLRYLPINPVSVCFLTLERTVERYRLDIEAWLKIRDLTDRWTEVRYEELVADLPRAARQTLDALEVPWDESILAYRAQPKRTPVGSPSYEEVSQPVYSTSIARWQNYERQLAPVLTALAPLIAALGYER